jgi:hypothetical protein
VVPAGEVAELDAFAGAVDRDGLGARAHVEGEHGLERGGRLDGEGVALGDFAADEVGQAAVGEGDIGSALHERDRGGFAEAAGAGGGGGAGGDAADDDEAERRSAHDRKSRRGD